MKCSYHECNETAVEDPATAKDEMQFCKTHDDEFAEIVRAGDAKGILRFWIKAQGGAKLAAKRMMGT